MRDRWTRWHGRLRQHAAYPFARDSVLLVVGNGLSAFLQLLFHACAGRLMTGVDYALLLALMALLNVITVPAGVLSTTLARYVAEFAHRDEAGTWLHLVRREIRRITPVGLVGLALWCIATPALRAVLKAPSTASVAMVGVIAFLSLYLPIVSGALTGSRLFGWSVTASVGSAAGRLALTLPILWLGGQVTGALGALAASVILAVLIAGWPLYQLQRAAAPDAGAPLPDTRAVSGYFWTVLGGQIALFLLINADVMFLPRCLAGEEMAAYGKAAQLSRAVLFMPLPIAVAVFPRAVNSSHPRLILGPALFTLGVCVLAAALITFQPALTLRLMYGESGAQLVALTRWYVWATIPLSLVCVLMSYLWARHATKGALGLLPVTLGYLLLLAYFHRTPHQMILCLMAGGLAALVVLGGLTARLLATRPRKTAAVL